MRDVEQPLAVIVARERHRPPRRVGDARTQDVILQICADARQVDRDRDAERAQRVGWPDAGELEELRRVDGTGGEDHLALGPDPPRPPVVAEGETAAAAGLDGQPQHQGAGQNREVGAAHDRVEIGRGRAVAPRAGDAQLIPGGTGRPLAADVGIGGEALADRSGEKRLGDGVAAGCLLQRQDMLRPLAAMPRVGAAREGLGPPEIGQEIGKAPAGAAGGGPAVVAGRVAPLVGERVDGARPAQHLAARIGDGAAAQGGLRGRDVAPVDVAAGEPRPVRGHGDPGQGGRAAGLEQEHPEIRVGRQAARQDAPRRACADDDIVDPVREGVRIGRRTRRLVRRARGERAQRCDREPGRDPGGQGAAPVDPLAGQVLGDGPGRLAVASGRGGPDSRLRLHVPLPWSTGTPPILIGAGASRGLGALP